MKRLVVTVLLLLVVLAAVPVFNTIRPPPAPVKPVVVAPAPAPPTPHVPTEFEREMAMTPEALMARWEPLVKEASRRFQVPPEWIRAVIRMESGGRALIGEGVPTISDMGAMGIMQVLPQTYADMQAQYGLGN
jgi:D-alanyl-D-alanine carboxypeptidase